MKKIKAILSAMFCFLLPLSAFATNEKLSLPKQCLRLFTETENLISDAEKQPGTHTQVSKIKNKLNQSKKQILEMDLTVQIRSCDHGLAKLTNLKAQDTAN